MNTEPTNIVFVANRYDPRTRIAKEVIEKLKQYDAEYKVLYGLPYLTNFKKIQTYGGLPEGKALSAVNSMIANFQQQNLLKFYKA